MRMKNMAIKASDKKAILHLLYHVRRDLAYGVTGSFGDGEKLYKRQINMVKRAHDILYKMVSE
jgi:hypothetical protein